MGAGVTAGVAVGIRRTRRGRGADGRTAQPLAAAPIFVDPEGEPIGYLPREAPYCGTVEPVIVHDTHG